ncbi:MAG TPA: sigma-70 family RNA polymerase sigma factor [Fimbriimonadaceae bacterium]|nr:sigma-70 family RNA polymerase sigma factor [Fimbriimonadaceae bacterium]HRJ32175.1 sigma-70 family RNA polymerase sigma factor [Fimbriimonadaceae bacterium]
MLNTLTQIRKGSPEASQAQFERLCRETYRQAYGFALRLTSNSAEAEDLVQETYLRAFRFFHRYDENLPFSSWLYRIMTNVHIDMIRRRGRMKTTSLDQTFSTEGFTWDVADGATRADEALLDRTMDEPIQLGLKAMTPEFRIAVLLSDVEGMAYEEIAEIMNTSVGTVRSRIHRGRKQLRDYLKKACPGRFQEAAR